MGALRRHPVLSGAFLLAVLLAFAFAGSLLWRLASWEVHEEEPLAPWMTVRYIGRSWDVSPREIHALAGLPRPEEARRPLTLGEIAERRGVPVEEVIAEVDAALRILRAGDGGDPGGGASE